MERGINAMPHLLYPWEKTWHSIYRRLGVPRAVWMGADNLTPTRIWYPDCLVSQCTDYASPAHTTTTTSTTTTTTNNNNNNNNNQKKDDDCGGNNEKCGMRFSQQWCWGYELCDKWHSVTGQVKPHILRHGSPFKTELLTQWQSDTLQ